MIVLSLHILPCVLLTFGEFLHVDGYSALEEGTGGPGKSNMSTTFSSLFEDCPSLGDNFRQKCISDHSCVGRCGSSGSGRDHVMCSCDVMCAVYKDCCFDAHRECPDEMSKFADRSLHLLTSSEIECLETSDTGNSDGRRIAVISGCPSDSFLRDKEQMSGTKDTLMMSPVLSREVIVTDIVEGITYKGMDVFLCNNPDYPTTEDDTRLVMWDKEYLSNTQLNLSDVQQFFARGRSSNSFLNDVYDIPPHGIPKRRCPALGVVNVSCHKAIGKPGEYVSYTCQKKIYTTINNLNLRCSDWLDLQQLGGDNDLTNNSGTPITVSSSLSEHSQVTSTLPTTTLVTSTLDNQQSLTTSSLDPYNPHGYNCDIRVRQTYKRLKSFHFRALIELSRERKLVRYEKDRYSWIKDRLHMACDIQAMYFPTRGTCENPHLMLLVVQYDDTISKLVNVFAKKLIDFLHDQPVLTSIDMEHVTSENGGQQGEPVSFIYFIEPRLTDVDFDAGLNNLRTAVQKVMFDLRDFDFWKRNIILCYHSDNDISVQEIKALNTVSFSKLKWIFDLCEMVPMGEKIQGGASTTSSSPVTAEPDGSGRLHDDVENVSSAISVWSTLLSWMTIVSVYEVVM